MTRSAAPRKHPRSSGRDSVVITDGGSGCGPARASPEHEASATIHGLQSPALVNAAE